MNQISMSEILSVLLPVADTCAMGLSIIVITTWLFVLSLLRLLWIMEEINE